jgi:hypothetical protein
VYWATSGDGTEGYSTSGVTTSEGANNSVICSTVHLSIFGIQVLIVSGLFNF